VATIEGGDGGLLRMKKIAGTEAMTLIEQSTRV
jgi:hypothetical protein